MTRRENKSIDLAAWAVISLLLMAIAGVIGVQLAIAFEAIKETTFQVAPVEAHATLLDRCPHCGHDLRQYVHERQQLVGLFKRANVENVMRGWGAGFNFEYFFDRPAVTNAVDWHRKKYLNWAGGYTRRIARNAIKKVGHARKPPKTQKAYHRWLQDEVYAKPASTAPDPPHTHTGFLRDSIVYSFDPASQSTVVGAYRQQWLADLHELGGSVPMNVWEHSTGVTALFRSGPRGGNWNRVGTVMASYPARPFLGPALEKASDKFPDFWRDAVGAN